MCRAPRGAPGAAAIACGAWLLLLGASCDDPALGPAPSGGTGGHIAVSSGGNQSGGGGQSGLGGPPLTGGGGADGAFGGAGAAGASSAFTETLVLSAGAGHSAWCAALSYPTSPPSSGMHYPSWAAYQTYTQPVPWGFLVHGLEHGAIVVVYNCPAGCAAEVAAAQAWIDSLPDDVVCSGRPRLVLAPDPTLTCRWAAAAWQWTLRGNAPFDRSAFQHFYDVHYENPDPALQAPEQTVCGQGIDEPAEGWCPA